MNALMELPGFVKRVFLDEMRDCLLLEKDCLVGLVKWRVSCL